MERGFVFGMGCSFAFSVSLSAGRRSRLVVPLRRRVVTKVLLLLRLLERGFGGFVIDAVVDPRLLIFGVFDEEAAFFAQLLAEKSPS
jgi:predicted acyltransferase